MKLTSKKKRILLFSATSVIALAIPSVALTLNAYSLSNTSKNSNQNQYGKGTVSDDFFKNLTKEQVLKNISYDSNGKIIPLKLVGSDGKVYQPNTNLLPSGISKDNLLKSRDNVLNTPDSLNEYNKTNQDVKNSFISNLPKDLVGKQITIDENC